MVDFIMHILMRYYECKGTRKEKVKETIKNAKLAKGLEEIVDEAKKLTQDAELLKEAGPLLYNLGARLKPQVFHHAPIVVK